MTNAASIARHVSPRVTPQTEKIPGSKQEQNNAGGYAYVIEPWLQFERFLLCGSADGTYYQGERELTKENAANLRACADADPGRTVRRLVELDEAGACPKKATVLFALAALSAHPLAKRDALRALPRVCRTGSDLLQLLPAIKMFRGYGRMVKDAVRAWFHVQQPRNLAYQVSKYQQRGGLSFRDVLRLFKPRPGSDAKSRCFEWIAPHNAAPKDRQGNPLPVKAPGRPLAEFPDLRLLAAVEEVNRADNARQVVQLIERDGLVREHIPTKWLNDAKVWEALVQRMPIGAMVRNLGKLTNCGALSPLSDVARKVCADLRDGEKLRRGRIHPLAILQATAIYAMGRGVKGSLTWQPVSTVLEALEDAFYKCFDNVQPTGLRHVIAVDVSGSMDTEKVAGSWLTARSAAAGMGMAIARSEAEYQFVAFSGLMTPMPISNRTSLLDVIKISQSIRMGRGTDCASPLVWACANNVVADCFTILTDNESYAGPIHVSQALRQYRERLNPKAKLAALAFTATKYSVGDPDDAGTLNCCGLDNGLPKVFRSFCRDWQADGDHLGEGEPEAAADE